MPQQFPFQIGDQAPDFQLVGHDEKTHKLSDFLGSKLVLYFYPKDDTKGCTQEACDLQERLPTVHELGAKVVGISPDSPQSHRQFMAKYKLSFLLLSDPDSQVARQFAAYGEKNMYGKISQGVIRTTFVLDERGRFLRIFPKVTVDGHADKVIDTLSK